MVGSEVTFLSAAAVTALDLASVVVGLLLLLLVFVLGFDFFGCFGFLDISGLLGTTWDGAASALASAADLVAWVVQGLSVIIAAFEADGWVDIVDGLSTASLAVDIDLGGSTTSGLDVGVVVVEGEVVSLVDNLTAWAGFLGGIEDVEVVFNVAFGGVGVQAAIVGDIVVKSVSENSAVLLGFISAANISVGIVSVTTTALEGVVVVLADDVILTADVFGVIVWSVVTALGVGWGSNVEFGFGDSNKGVAASAAALDSLEFGNLSGAASLSEGVEGSGSTASEGVVAVLSLNVSSTADLGGWVEGVEGAIIAALEVGITGNISASEGNSDGLAVNGEILAAFDLAASLSGWVIRGRATALEVVVVAVADNSGVVGSTAAKLG